MKTGLTIISIFFLFGSVSCKTKVYKCGDKDVKNLINTILYETEPMPSYAKRFNIKIKSISGYEEIKFDKENKIRYCKLKMETNLTTEELVYNVSTKKIDGKKKIYVLFEDLNGFPKCQGIWTMNTAHNYFQSKVMKDKFFKFGLTFKNVTDFKEVKVKDDIRVCTFQVVTSKGKNPELIRIKKDPIPEKSAKTQIILKASDIKSIIADPQFGMKK